MFVISAKTIFKQDNINRYQGLLTKHIVLVDNIQSTTVIFSNWSMEANTNVLKKYKFNYAHLFSGPEESNPGS